ncbi:MAG: dihydroxyacetone kinase subunit DhaK [candidate division WS1 bacterium]|jgi:dihydroxyacetone kinase|nr:dihydroxyacetone kinase subunit DhaK [candidate division WS1 bacterium]
MKKLINDPFEFVDETIEGVLLAHRDHFQRCEGSKRALMRADGPVEGKVAIVTGGGSGHIPVFLGYVGPGLCDAASIGNVFSSPSPDDMLAATVAAHGGAGVLHLYGNYSGDRMNFGMAAEMAEMEDVEVKTVLVRDDVVSAPVEEMDRRRAVAGLFFAYKIAGARAEEGATLGEVAEAAEAAAVNTRSMGVALTSCTIPAAGEPTFQIGEDEMELGMGIHGEQGLRRGKIMPADAVVDEMLEHILADLPFEAGDEVAVLVNSLGATPPEELYIMYRRAHAVLGQAGIGIHRAFIGEYATSLEMAGASISLLRLDADLKRLLDAEAYSPLLPRAHA